MNKAILSFPIEAKNTFFLVCFMIIASGIFAQNDTLSVQGVLTKSDGTAVDDGNYPITFSLWTASGGGTKVHEETIQQVETTGGVYSVLLGQNGFDPTATFSQVYYLGVSVNGGAELTPRPRLTHAPYTVSVIGQNNIFPSVGAVLGDAIRAKGGTPTGGTGAGANGFAFGTDGDPNGGLFSNGANNVQLLAGGTPKIQLSSTLNELFGNTNTENVFATGKVNPNTGFGYQTGGTTTQTGLFFLNSGRPSIQSNNVPRIEVREDNTNYYHASAGHNFSGGNLNVSGLIYCAIDMSAPKVRAGFGATNTAGFSFYSTTLNDTGMFSDGDGQIDIKSNNSDRITLNNTGRLTLSPTAAGGLYIANLPSFNLADLNYNITTGQVGYDNSTRRSKTNIQPLVDDFKLTLKAMPKQYERPNFPGRIELGYIAEEMDSIGLKKLCMYDSSGLIENYNYKKMILYVVEVLKMQDAAITQMQAEMDVLKKENEKLQAANAGLNASLQKQQSAFSSQLTELEKRMKMIENVGTTGLRK